MGRTKWLECKEGLHWSVKNRSMSGMQALPGTSWTKAGTPKMQLLVHASAVLLNEETTGLGDEEYACRTCCHATLMHTCRFFNNNGSHGENDQLNPAHPGSSCLTSSSVQLAIVKEKKTKKHQETKGLTLFTPPKCVCVCVLEKVDELQ